MIARNYTNEIDQYEVAKTLPGWKKLFRFINIEPIIFMYMLSTFLKMPVFFALIYDKVCFMRYSDDDVNYCENSSATSRDYLLQSQSNFVFQMSSICLMIPAMLTATCIGSFGDLYSRKLAILLPLVGLILNDLNYLVQATYLYYNVYYLLISDLLFGFCGGYNAVLSTTISYATDFCKTKGDRSLKMAFVEGATGLGGTIGFVLSGFLLEATSYSTVFLFITVVHVATFIYAMVFIKNTVPSVSTSKMRLYLDDSSRTGSSSCFCFGYWQVMEFFRTIFRRRDNSRRKIILLLLIAFFASFIVFGGSGDIMFYYLKHQLNWSSSRYGVFRGVYYGSSTLMVFIVYPLLRLYAKLSDSSLAMIGLVSRAIGCMMLAFAFSTWFVFTVPIVYMFNRFAAAALRSMISNQVEADEQGKIFAAVGFLQSACSLVATGIFNSILPVSYSFFPGLSYVLMTVIMLIPISIILYLKLAMTDFQSQHSSGLDIIDERDDLTVNSSNQAALLNSSVDGVVEHF